MIGHRKGRADADKPRRRLTRRRVSPQADAYADDGALRKAHRPTHTRARARVCPAWGAVCLRTPPPRLAAAAPRRELSCKS